MAHWARGASISCTPSGPASANNQRKPPPLRPLHLETGTRARDSSSDRQHRSDPAEFIRHHQPSNTNNDNKNNCNMNSVQSTSQGGGGGMSKKDSQFEVNSTATQLLRTPLVLTGRDLKSLMNDARPTLAGSLRRDVREPPLNRENTPRVVSICHVALGFVHLFYVACCCPTKSIRNSITK